MENKRDFKENDTYGYISIPYNCHIKDIKTLSARYDVSKDMSQVLSGMWCFDIRERGKYDEIIERLKRVIVDEYSTYSDSKASKNYWITVPYPNKILDIKVTKGRATTETPCNAFSTREDADGFLLKIKRFMQGKGIDLTKAQ